MWYPSPRVRGKRGRARAELHFDSGLYGAGEIGESGHGEPAAVSQDEGNSPPNQPAARVDLSLSLRACSEEELAPHAPLVHGAAFKDWNAIRSQGLGGHAPCRFWTRAPRKGERMFGMPRAPDVLVYVRCLGSGLGEPLP